MAPFLLSDEYQRWKKDKEHIKNSRFKQDRLLKSMVTQPNSRIYTNPNSTSRLGAPPNPQLPAVGRTCSSAVLVVGAVGVMTGVAGGTQSFQEGILRPDGVVGPTVLRFVGVNGEQSVAARPDDGRSQLTSRMVMLPSIASRLRWPLSAANNRTPIPLLPPAPTAVDSIANNNE